MASAHQPMKVIDGEFAFVGPMAFDSGLFVGNMLMSLLSQRARADNDAAAVTFAEWLGDQIQCFWKSFVDSIVELWTDKQSLLVKVCSNKINDVGFFIYYYLMFVVFYLG